MDVETCTQELAKAKRRLAEIERRNWPPLWVANGLPCLLYFVLGLGLVPYAAYRDWLLVHQGPHATNGILLGLAVAFVTAGILHGIRSVRGADYGDHYKVTGDIQFLKDAIARMKATR